MLALHSLVEAHRREGTQAPRELVTELQTLASQLAVRALPPIPS
jgi:hypothetical protein